MVSTSNNNNSNNVRKRLFQTSFNNEKSIQNLQNKQELILRSLTNYKQSLEKTQKIINDKFILYTKKYSEYKMLLEKYKLGINRTNKSNTIEKFLDLGRVYSNAYKNIEDDLNKRANKILKLKFIIKHFRNLNSVKKVNNFKNNKKNIENLMKKFKINQTPNKNLLNSLNSNSNM